ncbi:hypothetical protein LIER_00511 [Lithospermum erythrorhizon]|uniref:Uncharacterized protein n=1 Tax=Lithospermum erythrorhizon TaxID=34254 RepID=A0AAV3NLA5_LITER
MPHKVNFKVVTTGKDPLARISKRKSVAVLESSLDVPSLAPVSKKSRKTTKKTIPEDAPVITEVIPETFNPLSPDFLPSATITIPDHTPALDMVTSARESSPIVPSPKDSSSSSGDPLGVNYSLPSGDMEDIMGYSILTELHVAFSHFQLKVMKCAHGLFLKWKEFEESRVNSEAEKTTLEKRLSEVMKERDEARAQAEDLRNKHANLQEVCNGLVKSKSDLSCKHEIDIAVFRSSLEESEHLSRDLRAQLNSSNNYWLIRRSSWSSYPLGSFLKLL